MNHLQLEKRAALASALLVICAAATVSCASKLPPNTPVDEVMWLDQNWSEEQRRWFHHTSQGSATIPVPYDWFVALEQPRFSLIGRPGLLVDEEHMQQMGFIPSEAGEAGSSPDYNPDRLPVGFARMKDVPISSGSTPDAPDRVGFTCAACHSGQLEYDNVSIRIDGGPSVANIGALRERTRLSLAYTRFVPFRFGRFADRVLGADAGREEKAALEESFKNTLKELKAWSDLNDPLVDDHHDSVEEGFARLDALNRIGNRVFGQDLYVHEGDNLLTRANLAPLTAPVSYPHIWTSAWFNWVQYDGSIMQPMIRNAGEALGVGARVNLLEPGEDLYRSSVAVRQVFELEQLLAGEPPLPLRSFTGLVAPEWPTRVLGEIDRSKASKGGELYERTCKKCHGPVVDSREFWQARRWTDPSSNEAQRSFLKVPNIPVAMLGTDPAQAAVLAERAVRVPGFLGFDLSSLGCGGLGEPGVRTELPFAAALGIAVERVVTRFYDDHDVPSSQRDELDGYRANCLRADPAYKARPLDGIWATAPFFHNGSVPNLYELLSPVVERSKSFPVGNRTFDPVRVGYVIDQRRRGDTIVDTSKPGNSNEGHEFNHRKGVGVIGPGLSESERWQLVEFLKTL